MLFIEPFYNAKSLKEYFTKHARGGVGRVIGAAEWKGRNKPCDLLNALLKHFDFRRRT